MWVLLGSFHLNRAGVINIPGTHDMKEGRCCMRNRTLWILVLLAAVVATPMLSAEEAAPTVENPQELILPGVNTDCDATPMEVEGERSEMSLDTALDGTYGARNLALCWEESRTTYSCSCFGNTRYRKNNQSRTCCDNGWCSGWSTYSSSCTNYPCP